MIEILLVILWIILLAAVIKHLPFFRNIKGLSYKTLLFLFLLRVIAGQLYVLVYTYYYDPLTADIHRYFLDGKILYSALWQNPSDYLRMLTGIGSGSTHLDQYYQAMTDWYRPWVSPVYNDNRILIRFNALMNIFSLGILQVNVVIANFIALTGFIALYRFAARYVPPEKHRWLMAGVFLIPSVIFWSSGVIKETLLFPVMGFLLLYTDKVLNKESGFAKNLVIAMVMLSLFLVLKAYILFLILPCYVAFRIFSGKNKNYWWGFPLIIAVYFLLILIAGQVLPQYNLIKMIANKHNEFIQFAVAIDVGSLIHEVYLEPTWISILNYMPRGFANTLLYPHLLQNPSPIILMAGLENLLILIIILMIIYYGIRRGKITTLAWMGIWLTIITFTFVGTIAPVSGSLVRYKIPALPFLWMAFICVVPVQEFEKWTLSKMKKYF